MDGIKNCLEIRFDRDAELVVRNNGAYTVRTILEKKSDMCVRVFRNSTLAMACT